MSKKIHRYINIESLPKKGKLISFKDCVRKTLYFEYKDICDYVHIEDYDTSNHMLIITFPNIKPYKQFKIHTDNFKKVKFGNMIDDTIYYNYKYEINDVVNNNMGNITILDKRTFLVGKEKQIKRCFYHIECNLCHNKRWIEASYLNHEKHQYCNKCGIHTYYPEKFIINLLDQLNIKYITQFNSRHEKWCNTFYYDFYINNNRIIIETNGNQHYEKIWNKSKHTLDDIKKNDNLKKELALKNNIKHYIVLDCRKSDKEWIQESVMKSELPILFNFSSNDIDWEKCHSFAISNLVYKTSELFNLGYSKQEIEKIIHKSRGTINAYLHTAYKLNLCNRYPFDLNKVPIVVYKNGEKIATFETITETKNKMRETYNVPFISRKIKESCMNNTLYHGFLFQKIEKEVYEYENSN